MRVQLDMPIFSSPTDAWGHAIGEVDVPALPAGGGWMELPIKSAELKHLGMPSPMLVWSVLTYDDGSSGILLDGVVAKDVADAVRIARILERQYGFFVDEYDRGPFRHE